MRKYPSNAESDELVADPDYKAQPTPNANFKYAVKSQLRRSWRPRQTLLPALLTYFITAATFLTLGIVILVRSSNLHNAVVRYDNAAACTTLGTPCVINFTLEKTITAPAYVYYRISGFYQNHLEYVRSIYKKQLNGKDMDADDLDDCKPYRYNRDIGATVAIDGTPLDPNAVAIPCGVAARTLFSDSYQLTNTDSGTTYTIRENGIAWESDVKHRFKNVDVSRQWLNIEDERFMVWMKIAAFNDFQKLWGIIDTELPAGNYSMRIDNNWDVYRFNGEKYFELADSDNMGGRNIFLGAVYTAIGALSALLGILFSLRLVFRHKKRLRTVDHEFNMNTHAELGPHLDGLVIS